MPSINVDLNYPDHPKTTRLMFLLGRGAEILPIRLWCWVGKHHSESGRLTGYSTQEIEASIGWRGKAGKAVEALERCGEHIGEPGFLAPIPPSEGGGWEVVGWTERNGHIAVFRERSRNAARKRWDDLNREKSPPNEDKDACSNASSIRQAMPLQCSAVQCEEINPSGANAPREKLEKPKSDFVQKAEACKKKGLNIYALTGKFYKDNKLRDRLPQEVVESIVDEFLRVGDVIHGAAWPYFRGMLYRKSREWNAQRQQDEHNAVKKAPPNMAVLKALAEKVPGLQKMLNGADGFLEEKRRSEGSVPSAL